MISRAGNSSCVVKKSSLAGRSLANHTKLPVQVQTVKRSRGTIRTCNTLSASGFAISSLDAVQAQDSRKVLQKAIADQLTGPHFDTWLDGKRFQADRLVTQTRRLWYYSTLLLPGALGRDRDFSEIQLQQLGAAAIEAFKDMQGFRLENGGWRFSFEGNQTPQVHMYTVAFTLYALSTFYGATKSDAALNLANELFDNIYSRTASDGGVYPEAYELDFKTKLGTATNGLGHYMDRRTVNTHIHMVEALTAYHQFVAGKKAGGVAGVARQSQSASALKDIANLVVAMKTGKRIVELRESGDARNIARNLRAPSSANSDDGEKFMFLPGHNVEATFLVHDAFDVLDLPGPADSFTTDLLDQAHSRMQIGPKGEQWLPHIYVNGSSGKLDDDGEWSIGTREWEAEINWWAQMELLNALVHADQRLGGPGRAGDKYIERAVQTWQLVSTRFVSPSTGALYETLDNNPGSTTYFEGKGEGFGPWKASYHTSRALVRSLQALSQGFKGVTPVAPSA